MVSCSCTLIYKSMLLCACNLVHPSYGRAKEGSTLARQKQRYSVGDVHVLGGLLSSLRPYSGSFGKPILLYFHWLAIP